MKTNSIKTRFSTAITFLVLVSISCGQQNSMKLEKDKLQAIFPKGELGSAENFTGKAWHIGLVATDTVYNTVAGNVYFEPAARSNWHTHPGGQILVITDGTGYHQIKGQPRQTLKKGDVVKCPPNVMHWHGASPESGMQQLYIVTNTEKGIVNWLQPVSDAEYTNAN